MERQVFMKILYAIQGTGNGHVSRATEIIPHLRKYSHCDVLISGFQNEVEPDFHVKYRLKGLGFVFGMKGGVDIRRTLKSASLTGFLKEIHSVPVEEYDLVINDFEPVTAWACKIKKINCSSLSHQGSLLSGNVPHPAHSDLIGQFIINNYAPADHRFGFHFAAYDDFIFTPVIRSKIRNQETENADHYTVYLPAWDVNYIISFLEQFKGIEWHIFSKHSKESWRKGNFSVFPVSGDDFTRSMASSTGVLCGAGFETPAEALFMKKKLMVMPMTNQYEQQCNAEALSRMGVPVIRSLSSEYSSMINKWLKSEERIHVDYPDQTESVIKLLLEKVVKIPLHSQLLLT